MSLILGDSLEKALIIGGNGFFGRKFREKFNSELYDKRIESMKDAENAIEKSGAEVLINCAGKTGKPNVDWCETHRFETFTGNVELPIYLAEACKNKQIKMVHLGSGCVYTGSNNGKGFSEEDKPNFYGSFYSRTKALSEEILLEKYPDVLQLRIRMPVDDVPSAKNLITKITKYKKLINVENSLTFVNDFIDVAQKLIEKNEKGIFNIVNQPAVKHEKIIEKYREIVDDSINPEFISVDELEKFTTAKRSNCVLNTDKLKSRNIELRNSINALEETLQKYKQLID